MPHKDEIVVFEGGEWSDSWATGPYRALCDFSLKKAFEDSDFSEHNGDRGNDFVEWLIQHNYIEAIKHRTFFLEVYGEWEQDSWD